MGMPQAVLLITLGIMLPTMHTAFVLPQGSVKTFGGYRVQLRMISSADRGRPPLRLPAPQENQGVSRKLFLNQMATICVLAEGTIGGLSLGAPPASADSTGKYSTKATAKKRYLPRIAKGVQGFEKLKGDIENGSATSTMSFFIDQVPDAVAAMDLYGSAMKRGELPDKTSRALQKQAAEFGDACKMVAKGLSQRKTGNETKELNKAYDQASAALNEFLKIAELDPIGSPSYASL